ncbi:L-rhamnose-binding lectin SML-like, partial [Xenentodon cancila]
KGQIIVVYGADYGRRDQSICSYNRPASQIQNVVCSSPTKTVAERCNGKKSCTIRVHNTEFGDPCQGTYKYLEVSYACKFAFSERAITCDDLNNVHRLKCDTGVISVASALYGRADRETCSSSPQQTANTHCSQDGTVDVIKNRCDGKQVCEINTNVVRTSDPCFGTYKYLETNYTCNPAIHLTVCEGSLAHLTCEEGQIIVVYGADYGRRDQSICSYKRPASQIQNVVCSSPTKTVAERCNGKNSCTIRVRNTEFGDPCQGTYKYLEVSYVCECK